MTPRNIYDVPIVLEENNEEDDHGISEEVYQECEYVGGTVFVEEADDEDLTALPRDDAEPIQLDASIAVDEVYMQLDGNMFIDDSLNNEKHDTNANDEEKISRKDDTVSEHEEEFSSNNDTNFIDGEELSSKVNPLLIKVLPVLPLPLSVICIAPMRMT